MKITRSFSRHQWLLLSLLLLPIISCPDLSLASDQGFSWPIDCIPGISCVGQHFRIGYPDISGAGKSFSCGTPGYRGHHGTDIVVSSVEQDVHVLAAADGIVHWIQDGLQDHCPNDTDRDCDEQKKTLLTLKGFEQASLGFNAGNYIILEHKINGARYLTLYAHLRNGSLRATTKQNVRRGQWIANVGSSGNSLIPHLHFGVYKQDYKFYLPIDPWKGDCNKTSDGLWAYDPPYQEDSPTVDLEEN
ncbi:MAG TPA: M23 family metallopeptidase [Desulfuromonadaceae bacterium]